MPNERGFDGQSRGPAVSRRQFIEVTGATAAGLLLAKFAQPRPAEAHHDATRKFIEHPAFYNWPEPITGFPREMGIPADAAARSVGWPLTVEQAASTWGLGDPNDHNSTANPRRWRPTWDGNRVHDTDGREREVPAWHLEKETGVPTRAALTIGAIVEFNYDRKLKHVVDGQETHMFSGVAAIVELGVLARGGTWRPCVDATHAREKFGEMQRRVGHTITPIGFDP